MTDLGFGLNFLSGCEILVNCLQNNGLSQTPAFRSRRLCASSVASWNAAPVWDSWGNPSSLWHKVPSDNEFHPFCCSRLQPSEQAFSNSLQALERFERPGFIVKEFMIDARLVGASDAERSIANHIVHDALDRRCDIFRLRVGADGEIAQAMSKPTPEMEILSL